MYVVLLGPPGAGKGTQAKAVADYLGVHHVSSGDLFREALGNKTELGLKAKTYMDSGALVPDEITIAMIVERLSRADFSTGAVLDGFPRTLEQAKALDEALSKMGKSVNKALCITVPDQNILDRLSGRRVCKGCGEPYHVAFKKPLKDGICDRCGAEIYQRADDNVETVTNRLKVYHSQTAPLIDYYSKAGKLAEVDGARAIDVVEKALIDALK